MSSNLRSGLVLVVAVTVSVGITALPIRAADESKALQDRVNKLEKKVAKLEAKLQYISVKQDPINGLAGPHVIFEDCNVHVRSGSGDTEDSSGLTGRGNLIVGYNENVDGFYERSGSHNLVVGRFHEYTNWGGFVAGTGNFLTGQACSVSGGLDNAASGDYASVSGGTRNDATANYSSVSGGVLNVASGNASSVSGGSNNSAGGLYSSVSGGATNLASGDESSVGGGRQNESSGRYSSISGGGATVASGIDDWRAGSLFEDN
ncbi:MAG: hypothetical protein HUU46_01835 [Candidatus Hydrogenedentes bacterium]|nr:hypothetical protein [Candidatus Hydrogenedentota bacterium]